MCLLLLFSLLSRCSPVVKHRFRVKLFLLQLDYLYQLLHLISKLFSILVNQFHLVVLQLLNQALFKLKSINQWLCTLYCHNSQKCLSTILMLSFPCQVLVYSKSALRRLLWQSSHSYQLFKTTYLPMIKRLQGKNSRTWRIFQIRLVLLLRFDRLAKNLAKLRL